MIAYIPDDYLFLPCCFYRVDKVVIVHGIHLSWSPDRGSIRQCIHEFLSNWTIGTSVERGSQD